jgi:hypothetical protein
MPTPTCWPHFPADAGRRHPLAKSCLCGPAADKPLPGPTGKKRKPNNSSSGMRAQGVLKAAADEDITDAYSLLLRLRLERQSLATDHAGREADAVDVN